MDPYNSIVYWAFTWSPNYKKFDGKVCKLQYQETIPFIDNLKLCCSSYTVYPELTKAGNLHYHGIFELKDTVKWYKKVKPTFEHNGFLFVKKVYSTKWFDYINKDKDEMEQRLAIDLPIKFSL